MSKKILLADDSITIQKVIELTFSDVDFDVVTVGNGRLALEKLAEVRPDVVLCDIIMPEKDGYEVCEQIKKNPASAHIPVLLLTGAFEPFDQERALRVGADGYLAKPFEPETLIAKVKDLLARARPAGPAPPPQPPVVTAPPPVPPRMVERAAAPPVFVPESPTRPVAPPLPPMPAVTPGPPPSFIPEEPFGDLDASDFGEETGVGPGPAAAARDDAFASVTPEESATLAGPAHSAPGDSATVMFQPGEVPWSTAPPPPERPAPPEPPPGPPAMGTGDRDVLLRREAEPGVPAGEAAYEVIEEDFEFGPTAYPAPPQSRAPAAEPAAGMLRPGATTLPPTATTRDDSATGAYAALRVPPPEPEPPPPPRPPARMEQGLGDGVWPSPAESFADLVAPTGAPAAASSEAAAVSVPVDMVETIAQRVVAQISERVVKEIAWEVIPDLAEALIKQEIERLKAELQKI